MSKANRNIVILTEDELVYLERTYREQDRSVRHDSWRAPLIRNIADKLCRARQRMEQFK